MPPVAAAPIAAGAATAAAGATAAGAATAGSLISAAGAIGGTIASLAGDSGGGTNTQTNTTSETSTKLGEETPEQKAAKKVSEAGFPEISSQLSQMLSGTGPQVTQVNNLFRDALVKFSTGNLQPTAEQYSQATDFVDNTFTKPAELQFGKFLTQAQDAQSNRAAALGRSLGDSSYTREYAGQAGEAAQSLSAQRGGLIAQRANYLSYDQPLQQLNALQSGGTFFNNAYNAGIQNRLNLLNLATQQQNLGLQQQLKTGTTTSTNQELSSVQNDAALSALIANAGQTTGNFVDTIGKLGKKNNDDAKDLNTQAGNTGGFSLGKFKFS